MAGFNSITGDESIVYADNVSFDTTERGGKITTNGQLLIGSTVAPHIRVGTLTSSAGSLTITNGNGTINLDLAGGGLAFDQIAVDTHTFPGTNPVAPAPSGALTISGAQVAAGTIGANVLRTDSLLVNKFTIEIQQSASNATTDSTKNGVAHFDSAYFSVDANAFVSPAGHSLFTWNSVAINQTGAVQNGYAVTAGALTISLPAGAALGDRFAVAIYGGTSWQITNAGGQTIRVANNTTVSTITSTALGDSIDLISLGSSTWIATNFVGNLTLA